MLYDEGQVRVISCHINPYASRPKDSTIYGVRKNVIPRLTPIER